MVREQYESLKKGENLREDLIALKQELKMEEAQQELLEILQGDYDLLLNLLRNPEPKVRKNAAAVLGRLGQNEFAGPIYEAYESEEKLFLKSGYLSALDGLDISDYEDRLRERLRELEQEKPDRETEKHIREELRALRKLMPLRQNEKHKFQGYDETYEVILTTGKLFQEITAEQIKDGRVTILKNGVRAVTSHIRPILDIPTYREILFPLNKKKLEPEPGMAAKGLAESNLLELLEKAHGAEDSFCFRLGVHSRMPLDKRSDFAKKCAFALERETGHRLYNSTSNYELEIRLVESREGTFLPLVKLYTMPEQRFAYRRHVVAASIRPEQAALISRLARPYMMERAQILDPFCGVGTMLLERERVCTVRQMYGIDIFKEAINGARENTRLAGKHVNYIQRDFFTFQHEYLFDEIITNMPERGQRTREEHDSFYGKFFEKAEEVLTDRGKIILYSNEKNYVKKQLRLRKEFTLIQEYGMDEKDNYYLFIIGKRNWEKR